MTDINYQIPVWETIHNAWQKTKGSKRSFGVAVALQLVLLVIVWLFSVGIVILINLYLGFSENIAESNADKISNLFVYLCFIYLSYGLIYIGIKRAYDLPISYKQMYRIFQPGIMIRLVGGTVLAILIVLFPLYFTYTLIEIISHQFPLNVKAPKLFVALLDIIIGLAGMIAPIYLLVRLAIGDIFVLDKKVNPWQSIKLSFQATRNNFWRLLPLIAIVFGIQMIYENLHKLSLTFLIPAAIVLIWFLPFSCILYAMIYKNLSMNIREPKKLN